VEVDCGLRDVDWIWIAGCGLTGSGLWIAD